MAVYLIESKADQQKLIDYVGEDTAKLFFTLKDRLKSPENDIYYWLKRDSKELEDRLSELQGIQTRKEKDAEASRGAELLYNQDGWKVYHITTYEASKKYGKNTKWCITGSKYWSNGERGEEYFNDYTSQGVEFYFYIKDGTEKYALAYTPQNGNYQVFDAEDDDITAENLSFLPSVDGLPILDVSTLIDDTGTFIYRGGQLPRSVSNWVLKIIVSDGISRIDPMAFAGCTTAGSIIIPDSVTSIGQGAFYNCESLRSVVIPKGVKILEKDTFFNCVSLESIELPEGLVAITKGALSSCLSLKSITLPSTITTIGSWAFSNCSLTSFTLPSSVITIGKDVFKYCRRLHTVWYDGDFEQWQNVTIDHNEIDFVSNITGELLYSPDMY